MHMWFHLQKFVEVASFWLDEHLLTLLMLYHNHPQINAFQDTMSLIGRRSNNSFVFSSEPTCQLLHCQHFGLFSTSHSFQFLRANFDIWLWLQHQYYCKLSNYKQNSLHLGWSLDIAYVGRQVPPNGKGEEQCRRTISAEAETGWRVLGYGEPDGTDPVRIGWRDIFVNMFLRVHQGYICK